MIFSFVGFLIFYLNTFVDLNIIVAQTWVSKWFQTKIMMNYKAVDIFHVSFLDQNIVVLKLVFL